MVDNGAELRLFTAIYGYLLRFTGQLRLRFSSLLTLLTVIDQKDASWPLLTVIYRNAHRQLLPGTILRRLKT